MKPKLLVVNLQNPNETHYRNPKDIGVFLLGRRLSNYKLFVICGPKTDLRSIPIESCDCLELQKKVNEIFNCGK